MGYSYSSDDGPKMCFNAAKSWQLGWYSDKAIAIDPLLTSSWNGRLVGMAEYKKAGPGDMVVVKLNTPTSIDYYINFNRQTGINAETGEGGDQVLVVSQGGEGTSFASSRLLAKLSDGQSFDIPNFEGSNSFAARITVNSIDTTSSPGYADVTIGRPSEDNDEHVYLNCGGGDYDDGTNMWMDDAPFATSTGKDGTFVTSTRIANANSAMEAIYQSERWSENLLYSIPLPNGSYGELLTVGIIHPSVLRFVFV